jgi:digeranylgeranylglycerophospholipid reductase
MYIKLIKKYKNIEVRMPVIYCDILIVGAGPAGSVAALYCSKQGLDTVLIEKNNEIGAHASTRIDASPDFGLSDIITELGLKTENLVYNSRWHAPSGGSFTLRSKIGEYYFKRGPDPDSFECSTAQKSTNYGCELILGANLKTVTINKNDKIKNKKGINEVIVSHKSNALMIKSKILIDASGINSPFHRILRIPLQKYRKAVIFGLTGKNFVSPDTSEIYFDAEFIRGGYFYMVTAKSGLSSVAIVLDSAQVRKPVEAYFYHYVRRNKEIAERIKSFDNGFSGEVDLYRLPEHRYQNMLFAGDAAGLFDPLMGYGIMPAILSGYYAGKYSVEAGKKGDCEELKSYERVLRASFNRRRSYLFRQIFDSLDNKDLDTLIKMANDLEEKTCVDDLMTQFSISGIFRVLNVFMRNLPSSGRLLAKVLGIRDKSYFS